MRTMYAITVHTEDPNYRVLAFSNQGRNHFETREEAENWLEAMRKNNTPETLKQLKLDKSQVDPIVCYKHGDATSIYVNVHTEPL